MTSDSTCSAPTEIDDTDGIYDVLVIGAGIQGAGVAQAAALQGWQVAVVEQYDNCAQGTSSKSSKLIHGGLRYLETFDFKLVFECLREKKYLLSNAPHLVKPTRFQIPVYKHSQRSAWMVRLGLSIYSVLSGAGLKGYRRLALPGDVSHWPISSEGLLALFEYSDAQTNDARLTEAVLNSAMSFGAKIQYAKTVTNISYKERVFELELNQGHRLRARTVVNAAGPWVNRVPCGFITGKQQPEVDLVQGSHLVVDKIPLDYCLYLESPIDGRAFFVLPWSGKTMIGTTETEFQGLPENSKPLQEEIDYLIKSYNHFFLSSQLIESDIVDCFSGLRVLPKAQSGRQGLNTRSRETLLWSPESTDRYVAIYGGKLTSYRAVGEKVIAKLARALQHSSPVRSTKDVSLQDV